MRAVGAGFDVVGFDVEEERVGRLLRAESFIDDVTNDDLKAALATDRYRPSANPADIAGSISP